MLDSNRFSLEEQSSMWDVVAGALRRWSILLTAFVLMTGGFWLGGLLYATDSGAPQSHAASQAPAPPPKPAAQQSVSSLAAPPSSTKQAQAQSDAGHSHAQMAAKSAPPPAQAAASAAAPKPAGDHDHAAKPAPASPAVAATKEPTPAATASAALDNGGDPAAGRLVFRKCQACHSMDPGKNMLGPSLADIIGRKAGTEANYNYSPAMKQANIVWSVETLDRYLSDPAKVVPGNKMPFPGLKTDHDRADIIAFLAASSGGGKGAAPQAQAQAAPPPAAGAPPSNAPPSKTGADIGYIADAKYTLRSGIAEGRIVYIGVGGSIEGKINPLLTAAEGQVVQLTLINGEGAEHDIVFPDQDTKSPRVTGKGASTTIAFRAAKSGDFIYYCGVPGHRLAGMEGQFIVTPKPAQQTVVEADISREPGDLPPPVGKREPQTVRVDLFSVEVEGRLAEGTTFGYWTFNGKVPGPFIRVRVGDTIDIHLKNSVDSPVIH